MSLRWLVAAAKHAAGTSDVPAVPAFFRQGPGDVAAWQLLWEHLDDEQREDVLKTDQVGGYSHCVVADGGGHYWWVVTPGMGTWRVPKKDLGEKRPRASEALANPVRNNGCIIPGRYAIDPIPSGNVERWLRADFMLALLLGCTYDEGYVIRTTCWQ